MAKKQDAVYLRAVSYSSSRGGIYTDDQVANYAAGAEAAGLPFGFYIYMLPQADPAVSKEHAAYFYKLIKQYPYSCIPVIDVETTNSLEDDEISDKSQITASVLAFAQEFRRLSGQDPMIYSSVSFANSYLGTSLGKYRLWIANWYCTAPGKTTTWSAWDMWQYTDRGVISGVPSPPTDRDQATSNIFLKTVTFDLQDTTGTAQATATASLLASYNSTIPQPANPTRSGYTFMGWYKDAGLTTLWDFTADTVTTDMTLYARWFNKAASTLTAKSAGYASIKISWPAVTGADTYKVYRATSSSGTYSLLKEVAASAVSLTDSGRTTGKTYYYKMKATATNGTATVTGTTAAAVSARPVPAKPGSFLVARRSSSSIKVTWKTVSGASGYEVYRKIGAGSWILRKTTSSLEFINTGLKAGTAYAYKVRAYTTVGTKKVYGSFTAAQTVTP